MFSTVLVGITGGSANAQEGAFGYGVKHDHVGIRGAQVFSGCSKQLADADVLVSGNMIERDALYRRFTTVRDTPPWQDSCRV
ncbi:hypothetical protein DWB85_16135 [Seongchinamella sediminis]|uniref:Uncharacterized protein n=1 Tax=Seongchinamella sediminis TaxID=2283635 RepID=A0A3L7DVU0_9GAMM|nr:hypothetical protein DWB85_16135 [Seongchinamella sediminis]